MNCFERDQNPPLAVNKQEIHCLERLHKSHGISIQIDLGWPNAVMLRTRNLGHIYRGCPIGFFNPVIPTEIS